MPEASFAGLRPHQQSLARIAVGTGFGAWAGIQVLELAGGECRVAFAPRAEILTPWSTLNGSVLNALVEIPSFLALVASLADGELAVTNDVFIQHMRALPADRRYEMTGRLVRRGRTMAWTEASVWLEGQLTSTARITKTIVLSR